MIDPRNIVLEVDGCPFQLEFNPENSKFGIIDAKNEILLFTKLSSYQHLGFIIKLDLIWSKTVPFDENQYEVLKGVFKERTSFYIYPNPDAEPTLKFLVNWISNFEFESCTGWFDGIGWFGTINLIGAELLSKTDIGEWSFYQELS